MQDQLTPSLSQSILKNAFGLALFAFVTAGVIAIVQTNTKQAINDNIAEAQARALYEITPVASLDNDLLNDSLLIGSEAMQARLNTQLLGPIPKDAKIYFAQKDQQTHTLIFPVIAPDGYTTAIQLLVGITVEGEIAGVRVIDHKETPGLGDKIELKKSSWVLGFNNRSLNSPSVEHWAVKKDGGEFDSFTGATITPRAIVNAVRNCLTFFQQNKSQIFALAPERLQLHTLNAESNHEY